MCCAAHVNSAHSSELKKNLKKYLKIIAKKLRALHIVQMCGSRVRDETKAIYLYIGVCVCSTNNTRTRENNWREGCIIFVLLMRKAPNKKHTSHINRRVRKTNLLIIYVGHGNFRASFGLIYTFLISGNLLASVLKCNVCFSAFFDEKKFIFSICKCMGIWAD